MIDPEQDITDQPDYREGIDWAVLHAPELVERYSSTNITGRELRDYLWKTALRIYPSVRGEMENDLRQTFFVAGAIRRIIDTLPFGPEAMREVFDIGMDVGQAYGAERWKYRCFLALKEKDSSWWRKKKGAASPNDIVGALSNWWWRQYAKEKGVSRASSKWEILIDTLGTREMCILSNLTKVEADEDGRYKTWTVFGTENNFQMMSSPVFEMIGGRMVLVQGMGEIVG
jgi:hypothetical protein